MVKISTIAMRGVRGVPDCEVRLGDAEPALPFVVTGGVASGKTRFLEAIAAMKEHCGPYGPPPDPRRWAAAGRSDARIEMQWLAPADLLADDAEPLLRATWSLTGGPSERLPIRARERLSQWRLGPDVSKIEYFHAGRLSDAPAWSRTRGDAIDDRVAMRLSACSGKYDWVRTFLVDVATRAVERTDDQLREEGLVLASSTSDGLAAFGRRLSSLTSRLRFVRVRHEGGQPMCWFARAGDPKVELSELSGSEQALVLIAAAFERLGLDRLIVLLDSPELFLHPDDHLPVFEAIAAMVPKGQLIVATISPAILRATQQARVHTLSSTGQLAG